MLVPSDSTVALGGHSPAEIRVWDWKQQKQLQGFSGFRGCCIAICPLPGGCFSAFSESFQITVNVADMTVVKTQRHSGFLGAIGDGEGRIAINTEDGKIRIHLNGAVVATVDGAFRHYTDAVPMALVGCRFAFAGSEGKVRVVSAD